MFDAFIAKREADLEVLSEAGIDYDELERMIESGEEVDESLLESGSTSDFPHYLSDKITKRLMWGYADEPSAWRAYTRTYTVPDFKPISFVRLSEMQELLEVGENGTYQDSQITEIVGPAITIVTYGRLFTLGRKVLIT